MFTARWRLFRLFGIPIYVDASWLVILALVTWTLATSEFRNQLPAAPPADRWLMGLIAAVAFFACIILHEMGHALVARSWGIPIRGITLFLFGGVAELGNEPPSAASEFFMAIGGPIVSAVLAAIFWAVSSFGTFSFPRGEEVQLVLGYLALINVLVLLFNLIPAFPLDGGRVLRSILWGLQRDLRRATYWASAVGQGFAWILIGVGIMEFIFVEGGIFNGIWLGLIGLFLNNAARSSYQQVVVRELLQGEPVRRFMNANPIVVSPTLDLQSWVDQYVYRYHRKAFPVATDGRLEGFISTQALSQFPREEWGRHTVAEAMRHDLSAVTISPDADALQALGRMQRMGVSRLLVAEKERLLGIISLKDLLRFLQLKIDLESGPEEPAQQL